MKKNIHPDYHPVCFVDLSTGRKFLTYSTMKSRNKKKVTVDAVEYEEVLCEVTADSHPVYTGEKRFVDTAGRVEKFEKKFRRRA